MVLIVDNEAVEVPTPTGPMRMRVFRPKDATRMYGGVVFFSEIFQITGPIARSAAHLAGLGYIVAVPEVYHELLPAGTVLEYSPADTARGNACKTAKSVAAYDSDAAAAIAWLRASEHCNGRIGVAGFCLGGALAFRAALHPAVSAAAIWYGTDLHKGGLSASGDDDTLARVPELVAGAGGEGCDEGGEGHRAPRAALEMLLIFGRADPHVPREGRDVISGALERAGVAFSWLELHDAAHAFMRDEHSYGRYNPELATLTYAAAAQLFARRLAA